MKPSRLRMGQHMLNDTAHFLVNQVLPVSKKGTQNPSKLETNGRLLCTKPLKAKNLPSHFTLTTWNIQMGYQQSRLREDLPTVNGDLILLQEVPVFTSKSTPLFSAQKSYYAYTPDLFTTHPNTFYPFVHRGQITMSDVAPIQIQSIPLPHVSPAVPYNKKKIYPTPSTLYTQYKTKKGTLGVYNLHLDAFSRPAGRKLQFKKIAEHHHATQDKYCIIAGDFNTFLGRVELALLTHKAGLHRAKTGGTLKFLKLDHILYSSNLKIDAKVVHKRSSDHSPIVAKVKIL
ncbi:MAG: endonuclease/exonuclease/phosphatase family protein [Nanoarchaeota archaeon]